MTVQRQERYGVRLRIALIALVVGLTLACAGFTAYAATSERIVTNRFSGLAIDGFDPVAYFVNRHPVVGLPQFEAWKEGVVWRFHNEGNRASFLAHPEVYGPQFGGYDPVDLARGVTMAGNPRFWVIAGERLYLFGVEADRDAFAADPKRYLDKADVRWPILARGLVQ
jgi:hypothetical protein